MGPKVVIITGCSSGIGYQSALKFAKAGYKTFATARNCESTGAKELIRIAKSENLPLFLETLDVTSDQSVKSCISTILRKEKRIDILINNAGFGYLGPIETFEIEEVKDQYETNVYGALRVIKEVAPAMRARQTGRIINISSVAGLIPFPLFGVYSSSKFALEALSESLRFELSHFGIDVVIVEPGSFLTKFVENRKHPKASSAKNSSYKTLNKSFFKRYEKTHDRAKTGLMSKVTTPTKVVDLIFKVATEESPKPRYRVGFDAILFTTIKKILPWQIWETLLHKAYKW